MWQQWMVWQTGQTIPNLCCVSWVNPDAPVVAQLEEGMYLFYGIPREVAERTKDDAELSERLVIVIDVWYIDHSLWCLDRDIRFDDNGNPVIDNNVHPIPTYGQHIMLQVLADPTRWETILFRGERG